MMRMCVCAYLRMRCVCVHVCVSVQLELVQGILIVTFLRAPLTARPACLDGQATSNTPCASNVHLVTLIQCMPYRLCVERAYGVVERATVSIVCGGGVCCMEAWRVRLLGVGGCERERRDLMDFVGMDLSVTHAHSDGFPKLMVPQDANLVKKVCAFHRGCCCVVLLCCFWYCFCCLLLLLVLMLLLMSLTIIDSTMDEAHSRVEV